MKGIDIGAFHFDYPVFLAPMAGVTDTAYRIIAHDMGCPLCYAEMVSSQGIHFRGGQEGHRSERLVPAGGFRQVFFDPVPFFIHDAAEFIHRRMQRGPDEHQVSGRDFDPDGLPPAADDLDGITVICHRVSP